MKVTRVDRLLGFTVPLMTALLEVILAAPYVLTIGFRCCVGVVTAETCSIVVDVGVGVGVATTSLEPSEY